MNRKNPKTSMTNVYMVDSPLMNLTELNPLYATYFMDKNFLPFNDPSYITIETSQFIVERYENGSANFNYRQLEQVNCSIYKDIFKEKSSDKIYIANFLEKAICMDFKSNDVVIGGSFLGKYFSNINIKMKKCKNSTDSKIICKSNREINEIIKDGFFELFYFDNYIDLNNYKNTFYQYFKQYFIVLDNNSKKFIDIFFKIVNVSTDAGYVFESEEFSNVISYDYVREQNIASYNEDIVTDFYINVSNNYIIYTRSYTKFQDFAAAIGGLLKLMTFIGMIITSVFTRYEMYGKMFNSLFDFDFNSEDMKMISVDEIKLSKLKNFDKIYNNSQSRFPMILNRNYLKNEMTNIKNSLNKVNKNKSTKIRLKCVNMLKLVLCFCCKKEKIKRGLISSAYKQLIGYLDYLKIIQILTEFKKLKNIIFSESQNLIFSLYSKPLISASNLENEKILDKESQLIRSYIDVVENQNKTINERLIKFMDKKYKIIFDEMLEKEKKNIIK